MLILLDRITKNEDHFSPTIDLLSEKKTQITDFYLAVTQRITEIEFKRGNFLYENLRQLRLVIHPYLVELGK